MTSLPSPAQAGPRHVKKILTHLFYNECTARPNGWRCAISYRDLFNGEAAGDRNLKADRELRALDLAHATQVLTGTLEAEGSSLAGRRMTGVAVSAKRLRIEREKQKEREDDFLHAFEVLQEELRRIDERIARLNEEIAQLRERLTNAQRRSEVAFRRMHRLEDLIDAAEGDVFDDERRTELKRALGLDPDETIDDAAFLNLARERLEEERRAGFEADIEAETIRQSIELKTAARDELSEAREVILNDTDASPEERVERARDALERSFNTELTGAEASRSKIARQLNLAVKEVRISERSALRDTERFDLDDSQTLDETILGGSPGPR